MTSQVTFFDVETIDEITWPSDISTSEKDYLLTVLKNQPFSIIKNATAVFCLLKINNQIIPLTICDFIPKNTYLVSAYTQYISYTIEELSVIKNLFIRKIAALVLNALGKILNAGKIDKCIHVNNWLFPTNIYSTLSNEQVRSITQFLIRKFPQHAILFRTLNFITDLSTINNLQKNKYFLIGSRRIHMLSKEKLKEFQQRKPTDLRRDEKILRDSGYDVGEDNLTQQDIFRMKELYDSLYLDKYSYLNPQYSTEFIGFLTNNLMFNIRTIKKANQIDAFIGCLTRNNITYAPLFGYDTNQPAKLGLYRMLSAIKINIAIENDTILHSSAGAGGFKRHRGHVSAPEYHAVYTKHLPIGRRRAWTLLKWIVNHIGMPLIKRYDK
ncbi:MAG: hypothetical protein H0W64_04790 [Gammaproteobacteria bacterium]|nr:hypothetical protein [Gammaproteobacteria bacterium]